MFHLVCRVKRTLPENGCYICDNSCWRGGLLDEHVATIKRMPSILSSVQLELKSDRDFNSMWCGSQCCFIRARSPLFIISVTSQVLQNIKQGGGWSTTSTQSSVCQEFREDNKCLQALGVAIFHPSRGKIFNQLIPFLILFSSIMKNQECALLSSIFASKTPADRATLSKGSWKIAVKK